MSLFARGTKNSHNMSARNNSWSSLVNAATIRHDKNRNIEGEMKNDKTADTVVTDAPPQPDESEESIRDGTNAYFNPFESSLAPEHGKKRNGEEEVRNGKTADTVVTDAPLQPDESEESIRDGTNAYFNPFESSWAPEHGKNRNREGEMKNDKAADTVVTDAPLQPDESEERIRDGANEYFNPFESSWAPDQEKTTETPGAAAEEGNDMVEVQELSVDQTEPADITPLLSNPLNVDNTMEIDDREQIDRYPSRRYPSRKRSTEEDAPKTASKRNKKEADEPLSKWTSDRAAPLKDDEPEIGERVYSCFNNGDWYWGMVKHKFKKGIKLYYSVRVTLYVHLLPRTFK
jgi:hypothetical protein